MRLTSADFEIESKVSGTKGFLYVPLSMPHPNIDRGIAELIAKEKLCDKFNVKNGDKIIIRVNLC